MYLLRWGLGNGAFLVFKNPGRLYAQLVLKSAEFCGNRLVPIEIHGAATLHSHLSRMEIQTKSYP